MTVQQTTKSRDQVSAFAQLLMRALHSALCLIRKWKDEAGARDRRGGCAPKQLVLALGKSISPFLRTPA